jgi:subtilisin family serine protease
MAAKTPDESDDYRWWRDSTGQAGQERCAAQARLIERTYNRRGGQRNARRARIDAHATDNEFQYLSRRDVVLTRDREAADVYRALGLKVPRDVKRTAATPDAVGGLHAVPLPRRWSVEDALREIDLRLGRGVATPDHVLHVCDASICPATEPIPAFVDQPEPRVHADAAADGRRAKVVVVDTGLREDVVAQHNWLKGVTGAPEGNLVGHYRGHGTFVAGVVRSVAPKAVVHVESLMDRAGAVLESDLAPALARALEAAPDIISMSAGTRTRDNHPLLSLQIFYEERLRHLKGTVLVAAAGNDNSRHPFWPAAFPWSLSVGALNTRGTRAGYSNYGSWVDVYARGSGIVNAYPTGKYRYEEPPRKGMTARFDHGMAKWSGTSFSTPIVTGLIASRMTWSGESALEAAKSLLAWARENAHVGVGAVLDVDMAALAR